MLFISHSLWFWQNTLKEIFFCDLTIFKTHFGLTLKLIFWNCFLQTFFAGQNIILQVYCTVRQFVNPIAIWHWTFNFQLYFITSRFAVGQFVFIASTFFNLTICKTHCGMTLDFRFYKSILLAVVLWLDNLLLLPVVLRFDNL